MMENITQKKPVQNHHDDIKITVKHKPRPKKSVPKRAQNQPKLEEVKSGERIRCPQKFGKNLFIVIRSSFAIDSKDISIELFPKDGFEFSITTKNQKSFPTDSLAYETMIEGKLRRTEKPREVFFEVTIKDKTYQTISFIPHDSGTKKKKSKSEGFKSEKSNVTSPNVSASFPCINLDKPDETYPVSSPATSPASFSSDNELPQGLRQAVEVFSSGNSSLFGTLTSSPPITVNDLHCVDNIEPALNQTELSPVHQSILHNSVLCLNTSSLPYTRAVQERIKKGEQDLDYALNSEHSLNPESYRDQEERMKKGEQDLDYALNSGHSLNPDNRLYEMVSSIGESYSLPQQYNPFNFMGNYSPADYHVAPSVPTMIHRSFDPVNQMTLCLVDNNMVGPQNPTVPTVTYSDSVHFQTVVHHSGKRPFENTQYAETKLIHSDPPCDKGDCDMILFGKQCVQKYLLETSLEFEKVQKAFEVASLVVKEKLNAKLIWKEDSCCSNVDVLLFIAQQIKTSFPEKVSEDDGNLSCKFELFVPILFGAEGELEIHQKIQKRRSQKEKRGSVLERESSVPLLRKLLIFGLFLSLLIFASILVFSENNNGFPGVIRESQNITNNSFFEYIDSQKDILFLSHWSILPDSFNYNWITCTDNCIFKPFSGMIEFDQINITSLG